MTTQERPYLRVWRSRSLAHLAVAQTTAALTFYVPVSALFLTSRGLNYTQIFLLESVLLICITVSEVPSSMLADRIDRRSVIVAGFVANAIAEILFAFGQNMAMFVVSFAISGVSIALLSGVDSAYVYEELGDDADAQAVGVFGHLSALGLSAGVVATVLGTWLARVDLALPALTTAVASVLAAVAAWGIAPRSPVSEDDAGPRGSLPRALRIVSRSPVLIYAAVASGTGFVLFNSVFTLNQPIFRGVDIPLQLWGVLVGAALLVAAVVNHHADRIVERLGRAMDLFLMTALGAVGFALLAGPLVAVIAGFFLVIVGMNARGPVLGALVNQRVRSSERSTVLSVMSCFGSLVGVAVNPVLGAVTDYSPSIAALVVAALLALLAVVWLPVARRELPTNGSGGDSADRLAEAPPQSEVPTEFEERA